MTIRLIRHQAKEMAGAFWEADRTTRFRELFPDVRQFIGRMWPDFVPAARSLLVDCLTRKDLADHLKTEIADALIEDNRRAVKAPPHDNHRMLLRADHPGQLEQKVTKALQET